MKHGTGSLIIAAVSVQAMHMMPSGIGYLEQIALHSPEAARLPSAGSRMHSLQLFIWPLTCSALPSCSVNKRYPNPYDPQPSASPFRLHVCLFCAFICFTSCPYMHTARQHVAFGGLGQHGAFGGTMRACILVAFSFGITTPGAT